MTRPLRTSRAVTARSPKAVSPSDPASADRSATSLSPDVESLLRAVASTAVGSPEAGTPAALPGRFKAELLAAYERRGAAPASRLRLLVRDVRWPAAALSAAAAACVVVFAGALSGGETRPGGSSAGVASSGGASLAGAFAPSARAPRADGRSRVRGVERELAFVGGEWEHVHPLPSSVAKVRVVDDQSLPLIGVGWTPDLDGP